MGERNHKMKGEETAVIHAKRKEESRCHREVSGAVSRLEVNILRPGDILALQSTVGNQVVQRLVTDAFIKTAEVTSSHSSAGPDVPVTTSAPTSPTVIPWPVERLGPPPPTLTLAPPIVRVNKSGQLSVTYGVVGPPQIKDDLRKNQTDLNEDNAGVTSGIESGMIDIKAGSPNVKAEGIGFGSKEE